MVRKASVRIRAVVKGLDNERTCGIFDEAAASGPPTHREDQQSSSAKAHGLIPGNVENARHHPQIVIMRLDRPNCFKRHGTYGRRASETAWAIAGL